MSNADTASNSLAATRVVNKPTFDPGLDETNVFGEETVFSVWKRSDLRELLPVLAKLAKYASKLRANGDVIDKDLDTKLSNFLQNLIMITTRGEMNRLFDTSIPGESDATSGQMFDAIIDKLEIDVTVCIAANQSESKRFKSPSRWNNDDVKQLNASVMQAKVLIAEYQSSESSARIASQIGGCLECIARICMKCEVNRWRGSVVEDHRVIKSAQSAYRKYEEMLGAHLTAKWVGNGQGSVLERVNGPESPLIFTRRFLEPLVNFTSLPEAETTGEPINQ